MKERLQFDQSHREMLLKQTYQVVIIALVIGSLLSIGLLDGGVTSVALVGLVAFWCLERIRRRGHFALARTALLNLLMLVMVALALVGEGSNDGTIFMAFPMAVLAGLLMSRRRFFWYCGEIAVGVIGITALEHFGFVGTPLGSVTRIGLWIDALVILVSFAAHVALLDLIFGGIGSYVGKIRDELETESLNWHKAAMTDPLTGLLNRRGFLEHAEWQLKRAALDHHPVALLMLDLDHFKKVNDNHGHDSGDKVLQEFGHRLKRHLRTSDASARLGGEEYCALLAQVSASDAELIASRFCQQLALRPIELPSGPLTVTVSIGVCAVQAGSETLEGLMQRADHALYVAKSNGRNQVVMNDTPTKLQPDRRRALAASSV